MHCLKMWKAKNVSLRSRSLHLVNVKMACVLIIYGGLVTSFGVFQTVLALTSYLRHIDIIWSNDDWSSIFSSGKHVVIVEYYGTCRKLINPEVCENNFRYVFTFYNLILNWVSIGSGNGLSPFWRQAITWTNVDLWSVETLGKNSS